MKTQWLVALVLSVLTLLCASVAAAASADKQLQNMKGSVQYQVARGKPHVLAVNVTMALADRDYAMTGPASLAGILLADSSRVLVGSLTKVQLASFNRVDGTNAHFVLASGKIRFIVQHPAGAKADYIFQTPTASVGVRGTEGDIDSSGTTLRVNVYEVCDPSEPVMVTMRDGQQFSLFAGQSLLAQLVNGIIQTQVRPLTQEMIDRFSPDFGVPTSWADFKAKALAATQTQAATGLNGVTGGYGSQVASALGGLFQHKHPSASPTPAAASDTCVHH
jgi:uncharacterized membrane protein YgdD (TMEM256/DUF423 family)